MALVTEANVGQEPNPPNAQLVKEKDMSILDKALCKFKCNAIPARDKVRSIPPHAILAKEGE